MLHESQTRAEASGRGCCTRCLGARTLPTPYVHHGIPGLCYACDGAGTRAAQIAKIRREREEADRQSAKQARMIVAHDRIARERDRHGTQIPPRARRDAMACETPFSTHAYAAATGLDPAVAFRELACGDPAIRIAFDDSGTAIGWIREF